MEKYRVALEAEERTALEQLVSTGKAASRKLTHARILLLADASASHGVGHTDEDIVAALGVSPRTVARVRKRFVTEGLEAALDHRPQPARPDKIKIKGDVEQKLIELACTDPPVAAATGPCNCSPTRWSSWGWSIRSAPRRCGRR